MSFANHSSPLVSPLCPQNHCKCLWDTVYWYSTPKVPSATLWCTFRLQNTSIFLNNLPQILRSGGLYTEHIKISGLWKLWCFQHKKICCDKDFLGNFKILDFWPHARTQIPINLYFYPPYFYIDLPHMLSWDSTMVCYLWPKLLKLLQVVWGHFLV